MNTIDDLKQTLRSHAPDLDHDGHARAGAVTGRVRAVRRRRAAVGAATLVAVLVAGAAAVTVLPDGAEEPAPADSAAPGELHGADVPETVTYQGYTFEYVAGAETRDDASLTLSQLPEHDRPLVVAWVSEERATIRVEEMILARGPAGTFSTPRLIDDTYGDHDLRADDLLDARAAGGIGVALYELSQTPPAGVTEDGITFRQEVTDRDGAARTDRTLVGAAIGAVGDREVSMEVVVPERPMFADFCQSGLTYSAADREVPTPYAVMYVEDRWLVEGGSGCRGMLSDSLTGADAGWVANSDTRPGVPGLTVSRYREDGTAIRRTFAPGETVTVSIRVQDEDFEDYVGDVPGLQLGVGLYAGE
ncbi:hypothetical protein [Nocardioides sambongensis]|uniref:hypothetical protein n=1 Tax=Nocardioides sambongensis TaxID=2589074 RepID=UPI00112EBE2C|nr:hypothetical protein [Nocardioides sambongensis]